MIIEGTEGGTAETADSRGGRAAHQGTDSGALGEGGTLPQRHRLTGVVGAVPVQSCNPATTLSPDHECRSDSSRTDGCEQAGPHGVPDGTDGNTAAAESASP